MKILFGFLAGAFMCIMAANAMEQCFLLTVDNMTCKVIDRQGVDWTSECTIAYNGTSKTVVVSGVMIRSNMQGVTGDAVDTLTQSDNVSENKFCWCKMLSPAVSKWIRMESGDATANEVNCLNWCSLNNANPNNVNVTFRQAMFTNIIY